MASSLVASFLSPFRAHPKKILFLYLATFLALLWPAAHFTAETDSSFIAPTDSMSSTATHKYESLYGGTSGLSAIILLTGVGVTTGPIAANLSSYAADLTQRAYQLSSTCPTPANTTSYYNFMAMTPKLDLLAANYVNAADTETFLYITYNCQETSTFTTNLLDYATVTSPLLPASVTAQITGIEYFQQDILAGVESDLSSMDTFILPLSLLILAVVLGSIKIMIIPVLTIFTTIIFSFGIMYPIARATQVVSFTSSVMMSLTIAMSVDYSLFLLSRLIEVYTITNDIHKSLTSTLTHAGHTIIASGTTLCLCFAGMLLFPMEMLRSVGIGATVSILCCLFVNLTFIPAMVYAFGDTLLNMAAWERKLCCVKGEDAKGNEKENAGSLNDILTTDGNSLAEAPLLGSMGGMGGSDKREGVVLSAFEIQDEKDMYKSLWYRMGQKLLNPKIGVPVLITVVACMVPIAAYFPQLETSIGFDLLLPKGAASAKCFDQMGEAFGEGTLSPYKLMFVSRNGTGIDEETFLVIDRVLDQLVTLDATPNRTAFTGIAQLGTNKVGITEYNNAFDLYNSPIGCAGDGVMEDACRTLVAIASVSNSEDETATYLTTILNVDPFSNEGTQWLVDARDIAEATDTGRYDVYLVDGAGAEYDAVKVVYDVFPIMITATLATVFVLMGVFFRSIVVPIRSVFSISLTLAWVYGLAVLVYQKGILTWTGLSCFQQTDYISWLPPVMTFSIIVGLGLDYDVFLISRVLEFREEAYTDNSSVLKGLYKTGGIITAAGIIMAVAFSGLLMSGELLLNQTAFCLVAAVLVDTFIVRTVLVPILLGFTGSKSWYPRKLPEARIDLE